MNGNSNLLKAQSFTNITSLSLEKSMEFKGIILNKTGGSHGTTEMYATPQLTEILGEAIGVAFQSKGYPTVYLIGNTIWAAEVNKALIVKIKIAFLSLYLFGFQVE
nr:hypothetical protein [Haemophilus parahaemolyticus]